MEQSASRNTNELPFISPSNYKIGDRTRAGTTIAFIFGVTEELIVYRDTDQKVQWETSDLTPTATQIHHIFARLHACMKSSVPKARRDEFRDQLAQALFLALTEGHPDQAIEHFTDVEQALTQAALYRARLCYGVSGTVTFIVLAGATAATAYLTNQVLARTFALSALSGISGAWASVLHRSSSLALGPFDPTGQHIFQGSTRIGLGILFGLFTAVASKANLLLGFAFENLWVMLVLTFLAGFSERFVPEMIKAFEDKSPPLGSSAGS